MKNAKKIAVLAMVGLLSTSLVACGGVDGGADGKIELTFLSWDSAEKFQPVIDEFQKENKDITIKMSSPGDANKYIEKLNQDIAIKKIPDVFQMSTGTRIEIMKNGIALDLTGKPFMQGLDKAGVDMYSMDGKQYGMPLSAWMGALVYNKELLKKVGYDAPPTDLEGFVEMGKKLADAGIKPYMENPNVISGSFFPMLGGYYAEQGKLGGKDPFFNGSEKFESWKPVLEQWNELVTSGTIPADMVGTSDEQITQEFVNGNLAMIRSSTWGAEKFKNLKYGVAPFPGIKEGEPFVGGGPDSPFALSSTLAKDEAKLKAAEKFMTFLNSEKGLQLQEKFVGKNISSSNLKNPQMPKQFQETWKQYISQGKYWWPNWTKKGSEMEKFVPEQFQLLEKKTASVDEVIKALQEQWDK